MLSLILAAVVAASGNDPQQLIAVLKSDAAPAEKAVTCKKLAVYGGKDAVPVLAALLADEKLASWARIALEAIPDSAADDALRDAAGKLNGKLLIGVINSIGVRRDAKAISALTAKLKDANTDVASAAAVALGHIGGPTVAATLTPLLGTLRPAAAEGCILCAERLKPADAAKLYDAVRKANVSKQKTLEATRGAILARGAAGIPLLVEQLKSEDRAFFNIALRTAREIPGREVAKALLAEMEKAAADRQPPLLLTLSDRGDAETLSVAIKFAKSGPVNLRLTAINVLERIGDPSCAPVLLGVVAEDDAALSQAAKSVLTRLPGKQVDNGIVALLKQSSVNARRAGIELIGARQINSAVPALLQIAENATVGSASLKVLGDLAGVAEIPALLNLLARTKSGSVEAALSTICARQTDRAACADKVVPALAKAEGPVKLALLRVLRSAGGPKALAAVRAATNDADTETKETALRALCDWPTADALPDVMQLARSTTSPKWKILALRGQLRLIPQQNIAADQKLAAIKELVPLIERTEEKRLLLAALGEIPAAGSLTLITPYLKSADLKEEAAIAAVAVAEKVVGKNPAAVTAAMKEAAAATSDKKLANRARQLLQQSRKK